MSEEKSKLVLDQLLRDTRSDLGNINQLHTILVTKVEGKVPDGDIQEWIMDIYLDKMYELEAKLRKIFKDLEISFSVDYITNIKGTAENIAFSRDVSSVRTSLGMLTTYVNLFIKYVEAEFSQARRKLRSLELKGLENVKPIEYVSGQRKKFVTSREELEKAKSNVINHPEDVMNYLRTAIDLAIREKFGFKKIEKMIRFLEDADKFDLPLPSYGLVYKMFSEGTGRIHEGKVHTPFEAREAIRFVSNFIDELTVMEIPVEIIEKFKTQSKSV